MKKLSVSVLFVLAAFAGCKKDKVAGVVDELDTWANKMCECKDKACADKTHEDYKKWENDVLEPAMKDVKKDDISEDTMKKGDAADKKRKDCRRKFNEPADAAPPAP